MSYIKVDNEIVVERNFHRPVAERKIRSLYPDTSLPARLPEEVLNEHGYFELHKTPMPAGDVVIEGPEELREDGQWHQTWLVRDFTTEEKQEQFEQAKQDLLNSATDMRWQIMTGGMTLPNGVLVGTSIDDQNRITSVVANAELAALTDADEVDFKAVSGWVKITIGEVKQIAGAIGQFVQACYTAERTHYEAINALSTREDLANYDIDVGWPETQPTT